MKFRKRNIFFGELIEDQNFNIQRIRNFNWGEKNSTKRSF